MLRYFLLASHYRSELNFSDTALEQAWEGLRRFYRALQGQPVVSCDPDHAAFQRYLEVMADDFNTPEALAVMFDLVRELNSASVDEQPQLAAQLRAMGDSLGLLQLNPVDFLRLASKADNGADGLLDEAAIELLIEQRLAARTAKQWDRADQIRDQLTEAGVVLEDGGGKTRWSRR